MEGSEATPPVRVAVLDIIPTPYRLPIYKMLVDEGYDVRLYLCAETEPLRWGELKLDLPTRTLRKLSITTGPDLHVYYLNPGVVSAIRKDRPDVLVVAGWVHPTCLLAMATARASGIPYVIASETHALRKKRSPPARIARSLVFAPTVRRAAAALATGSAAKSYLVALGARPDRVFIRPNACDGESIAAAAEAAHMNGEADELRRGLPTGVPVVAFLGRLLPTKGVELLLTAARQLQDVGTQVALLIAGDGPERARLESQARELDLPNVKFVGMLPPEDVGAVYAIADVLCLPSRGETWGVVLNEALAAGVPIVVSDAVGAWVDLVEPGVTGAVFETGDASSLASALEETLAIDREQVKVNTRQLVANWDYAAALKGFRGAVDAALRR